MLLPLVVALAAAAPGKSQGSPDARRLTLQSIREYNASDFEAALRDAKQAYELSGLPALLFNLGQCYRMLGRWKEAEFSFQSYLREQKVIPNRDEVLALLAEVHAKANAPQTPAPAAPAMIVVPAAPVAQAPPPPVPGPPPVAAGPSPAAAPPPAPPPAPSVPAAAITEAPPAHHVAPATWWLGGTGVAALVAGTVLGVVARSDGNQNGGFNANVPVTVYNRGQTEGLAADIGWSVGGALLVTAAVVALVSH